MPADQGRLRDAVTRQVLHGPGIASVATRKAAAANAGVDDTRRAFVEKVTRHAYKITDDDVAALKAAGVAEDEIFELAVCASIGESTRQLEGALAALDAAVAMPDRKGA